MTDWQQVGSLVPDSGTPTGLAIPLLVGDIATTGGVGTIGSFAGSELSQTAAGAGLLEGLLTAAPGAARAGAITGREASRQFGDLLFEQTAPEVAPEEEPE